MMGVPVIMVADKATAAVDQLERLLPISVGIGYIMIDMMILIIKTIAYVGGSSCTSWGGSSHTQ